MLPSLRAAAWLSRGSAIGSVGRSFVSGRICGLQLYTPSVNISPVQHVRFASTEAQSPQQTQQTQQAQTQTQTQHNQQTQQQQQKKLPTLKSVLRKFYLVTHPDKFTDHPNEKAVNEHSLRDFLPYIEEYKKNPRGTSLGKPKRIPLTFYIRNEATGELKKVTSELISNSTNSGAAKRRLMNLFSACGIESDFTFEKDVWIPSDTASLQEFLASSLFHARESLQKATTHNNYVNTVISDIERKYGFQISMTIGADSYYSPSENREVIDKLKTVISNLDRDGWMAKGFLKGIEISLDSENETSARDAQGLVYLSRREGKEDWELFLQKVEWNEVHADRAKSTRNQNEEARAKYASQEARKTKQEDLAKLIGVRLVEVSPFNQFECQHSGERDVKSNNKDLDDAEIDDYEKEAHASLDRLLSAKQVWASKNPKVTKKLRNLELTICPNMLESQNYHISRTGELRISTRMTAKELLDLLTTKVATLQELIKDEHSAEGVRDYVATRLGLKVLSVDYSYFYSEPSSVVQSRKAYDKLHKLSDKLRNFPMGGMTVGVSDHYGLNLDGSIFIKWDFTDEEAIMLLEGVKQQKEMEQKMKNENMSAETTQTQAAQ